MSDREQQARRSFRANVKTHEMIVLHEDGLYRHLRFRKPGTGMYGFDLVTWPGYLSITGDLDSYTFSRLPDMFDFFGSDPDYINAHYWEEKIVAGHPTKVFSEAEFRRQVVAEFMEQRHDWDGERRELFEAICEEVLTDVYDNGTAHSSLYRFQYRAADGKRTFEFVDTFEWDFKEWDFHYLYVCHAIVWGIAQYRAHKAAAPKAVTA